MMISIAASRVLRAAAERQREQRQASNQQRLHAPSISGNQNPGTPTSTQNNSR